MKKILILLFSLFVGLSTFCNANEFVKVYNFESMSPSSCTTNCYCSTNYSNSPGQGDFQVFVFDNKGHTIDGIKYECDTPGRGTYYITGENNLSFNIPNNYGYCKVSIIFEGSTNNNFSSCPSVAITKTSSCPVCEECPTCPEVDTGAILSGYIAIDDITDNYCISNGLCGEISTGMSTLYINNIWHESKPFLYVNIPEELDWDYTGNVAQMFIDIKGYNTDSDYMQSIIDINSYRPTSEDFTSIFVSGLTLIFPYLIFALFIVFMRKLIKRIFKH